MCIAICFVGYFRDQAVVHSVVLSISYKNKYAGVKTDPKHYKMFSERKFLLTKETFNIKYNGNLAKVLMWQVLFCFCV